MKTWMRPSILIAALFFITSVAFAQDYTTLHTIDDPMKAWTISFNQQIDEKTVNNQSVYITNSSNTKIAATITTANKKITITPKEAYTANTTYTLHVTKAVTSTNGKSLGKDAQTPFTFKKVGTYIERVESQYSSIVTNIIVKGHTDVFSVTASVNGQEYELKYHQGNEYSQGILSLSKGENVTINAYNADNQLLETKTVTVQ